MTPDDFHKLIEVYGPLIFAGLLALGNFINSEWQNHRNGKKNAANRTEDQDKLTSVKTELEDSQGKLQLSLETRIKVLEDELADCLASKAIPA